MRFLGTRVIGDNTESEYIVADVVSDGAILPHSVNVDEYVSNLLKQIETLKAELKSADESLKLFHSIASNGEQSVLSRLDGGVDVQDAVNWQDEPKKLTAREIALPNGQLRSYASYNNTGKGQPLSAEEVDGERLGE